MPIDKPEHKSDKGTYRIVILALLAMCTILHWVSVERTYSLAVKEMVTIVARMLGLL
jgi:hypothetical protein